MSSIRLLCSRRYRDRLFYALVLLAIVPLVLYILSITSLGTQDGEHLHLATQSYQACVHPHLEINHPSIAHFFKDIKPLVCHGEPNWVYVDNGTFRISKDAQKKHGIISCKYTPFRFNTDFNTTDDPYIYPMPDGAALKSDFFTASCDSADGKTYFNFHSGISLYPEAHEHSKKRPLPSRAMGYSVFMMAFDSLSRLTAKRKLPKTVSYFTSVMKGIELEGYNIVGDGTPAALLPILSGQTEDEMPESRKGYSGAKPMDDHPWVFKEFKNIGYVTQWAEDEADVGTFTYRMLGFSKPPVDHYMRPFYVKSLSSYYPSETSIFQDYCFGSTSRYFYHLKYFGDSFLMYGDKRKFMLSFHGEYSHSARGEGINTVQYADTETVDFLRFLHEGGQLNNTILILMSDHGSRFNDVRKTVQGKLEERLPFWSFSFPPGFERRYPIAMKNFRINTKRLSTGFDIHATLLDMLDYESVHKGHISERGISLFREIPMERNCAHAGVAPHWCACLSWIAIKEDDPIGLSAVSETIKVINLATEVHRSKCEILQLVKIKKIVKYSPNDDVLKFKQTIGFSGKADLSDKMTSTEMLYQVTFQTTPGLGMFEATVTHNVPEDTFLVNKKDISRINKYGDDPSCIMREYPYLRPYCYCKKA